MSLLLVHLPPAPAQHQQNPHPIQVWVNDIKHCKCVVFVLFRHEGVHWFLLNWCLGYQQFHAAVSPIFPVTGSKSTSIGEVSVYVDLAYIPSGASSPTVTVDFFRFVRSSCYIISGDSPEREELMRHTLDALLDGKISWPDSMQVETTTQQDSCTLKCILYDVGDVGGCLIQQWALSKKGLSSKNDALLFFM